LGFGAGYYVKSSNTGVRGSEKILVEAQPTKNQNSQNGDSEGRSSEIPAKVLDVLAYVDKNAAAPEGYVGGRVFKNLEQLLPKTNLNGEKIKYQEWDVNPKKQGRNRGKERLVTGNDRSAYFTDDHYNTFKKIR
jgi:ribonuclease T1